MRRAAPALELPRMPLAAFLAALGGAGAAGGAGGGGGDGGAAAAAAGRLLADIHVSLLRRVLEGLRATDRNVRVRARALSGAQNDHTDVHYYYYYCYYYSCCVIFHVLLNTE